jgi:hypothetical protein
MRWATWRQHWLVTRNNMNEIVHFYKPKKSAMGGGLFVLAIVFFGLTLPVCLEGEALSQTKLLGLIGFWFFGIMLTVIPLMFRLEIGADFVRGYTNGYNV